MSGHFSETAPRAKPKKSNELQRQSEKVRRSDWTIRVRFREANFGLARGKPKQKHKKGRGNRSCQLNVLLPHVRGLSPEEPASSNGQAKWPKTWSFKTSSTRSMCGKV
uniref:(northern house mosquito) hypothetical protein n=1 Tax=Culex pipiens TaxID=7175 RepID=A0A8D8G3C4_CULPI